MVKMMQHSRWCITFHLIIKVSAWFSDICTTTAANNNNEILDMNNSLETDTGLAWWLTWCCFACFALRMSTCRPLWYLEKSPQLIRQYS